MIERPIALSLACLIADLISPEWSKLAESAAIALVVRNGDDGSSGAQLLSDIRGMFQSQALPKIFSETIVNKLVEMEDRPWPEWKNGKPISKPQLARILGRFDIVVTTVRIGDVTAKGYHLEQFDDAFSRYLDTHPASQTVTPSQPTPVLPCDGFKSATPEIDVTVSKPSQPTPSATCDGVTVSKPLEGDREEI